MLSEEDLRSKVEELEQYYIPVSNERQYQQLKKTAIKRLTFILNNTTRRSLQETNIKEIIHCSLSTVYFFSMNTKMFSKSFKNWWRKNKYLSADYTLKYVLENLLPEKTEESIEIIFQFLSKYELWPYESFISHILESVLFYSVAETTIYDILLSDVHATILTDVKSARHRVRVLYGLLKSENWSIDRVLLFIIRLLDSLILHVDDELEANYHQLRKGFEVCLRRIVERVTNEYRLTIINMILKWLSETVISDDKLKEISRVVQYPAALYTAGVYAETFHRTLLQDLIHQCVLSSNHTYTLIGCRILFMLFDRQGNSAYITDPIIYHEFSQTSVRVAKYERRDKAFIRENRDLICNSLMTATKLHPGRVHNLRAVYSIMCSLVLEVPCGITAASACCLGMEIQQFALKEANLTSSTRYQLHGVVASMMSLVCWVHQAPVLYRYVNSVLSLRTSEAPQLNPPVMDTYSLEHQRVTWNKPSLFFEDWELRYGLWKHFHHASCEWE